MSTVAYRVTLATPIGPVSVTGNADHLSAIRIGEASSGTDIAPPSGSAVARAAEQLTAWFAGRRTSFDIPLAAPATPRGGVLRAAIAAVPYGETMSYGALAAQCRSGARAVGGACARNPFPIIIPCHRVTSANGAPERYSAGDGPPTKAWLIAHEARHRLSATERGV